MGFTVEAEDIADEGIRRAVEDVFRSCVGARAQSEEWRLTAHAMAGCYHVTVKGPGNKRERLFYGEVVMLPLQIREWLKLYPFR